MAFAIKGAVGFSSELAFAMGANRGEREQRFTFANYKKPLMAKAGIHAIRGVVTGPASANRPLTFCGSWGVTRDGIATGSEPSA